VLALHRYVADLIGRAGREHIDAAAAEELLAALLLLGEIVRNALHAPVGVVDAGDELAGVGDHLRHLDNFGAVQVQFRIDRIKTLLDEIAHRRRRGIEGARDVIGLDQPLRAQRLAVAHEQIHRTRLGAAVDAVEHFFFVVGQLHGAFARQAALLGHRMCLVSTLSCTRLASAAMSI
jgi:hypothetical protein